MYATDRRQTKAAPYGGGGIIIVHVYPTSVHITMTKSNQMAEKQFFYRSRAYSGTYTGK